MYPEIKPIDNMLQNKNVQVYFKPQHQDIMPGIENLMDPLPIYDNPDYIGSNKLKDKVSVISGGDSGIGRSIAVYFAKEGSDVVIVYLNEKEDAEVTKQAIESYGRKCMLLEGDLADESFSNIVINDCLDTFGKVDILVNNCAANIHQNSILDIASEQLKRTFEVNVFSYFYLTKAVLPYLKNGSSIINTTSITAYKGAENAIDYSCTKGALVSFTKSMALSLASQGIRVNAVSPGPIWTPFIPSTTSPEEVNLFGTEPPMLRAGQPFELSPAYVYLASDDSRYITGQTIHINGGIMV